MNISLAASPSVQAMPFEYVERKGLGHPDSICDAIMDVAERALSQEYRQRCGRVLHHNLDKALLVAGQTQPKLGGGDVIHPLQIIAGDRATRQFGEVTIPVDEIVEAAIHEWFRDQLRFVDPDHHVTFRSEIKPGSAELSGIFGRSVPVANDTSATVGFAPLSETEQLVLWIEQEINSAEFKQRYPVAGEDVKVMAVRQHDHVQLTIAIAFVDRFLAAEREYYDAKEAITNYLIQHARDRLSQLADVTVALNMLDDPQAGTGGMYLTVLGTSAESGDGGEVGRGNGVNGLISLNRPSGTEAAAGKNSVCHVGNIYNHLAHRIAAELVQQLAPVREAYVWLCSQIGRPIDQPWSTSVSVSLEASTELADVQEAIEAIVQSHLHQAALASVTDANW